MHNTTIKILQLPVSHFPNWVLDLNLIIGYLVAV